MIYPIVGLVSLLVFIGVIYHVDRWLSLREARQMQYDLRHQRIVENVKQINRNIEFQKADQYYHDL